MVISRMEVIIGGKYQGKRKYIEEKGIAESEICNGKEVNLEHLPNDLVLDQMHEYIRRLLQNHSDIDEKINEIIEAGIVQYIICDEVGSGIVPMDPFERLYRETVGRCMCKLTKEADSVIRIQCGIPIKIK